MNPVVEPLELAPELLLGAARAIAQTGRLPTAAFTAAARAAAGRILEVPPATLRDEMTSVLVEREVPTALQWMYEIGMLDLLLPELAATVDFSQEGGRRHKDVWEHTKQVVRQAVPRPMVRWAALLHDIGKVPTRTFTKDGKVHFHGHSEVGARMFDDVQRRFAFEPADRRKIRFLILHHLRANQYQPSWTDAAVRRFGREMEAHLRDLLDLSRADITSKRPGRRQEALASIHSLAERIDRLAEEDARLPPLPTGLGTLLMESLGLAPGKKVGQLKQLCEAAVADGTLEARQPSEYYLAWLRREGHA